MPETKLRLWYVTTASNHPGGAGYWEVLAATREEARRKVCDPIYGLGTKWAFMYDRLDDVHELDRNLHGRID